MVRLIVVKLIVHHQRLIVISLQRLTVSLLPIVVILHLMHLNLVGQLRQLLGP